MYCVFCICILSKYMDDEDFMEFYIMQTIFCSSIIRFPLFRIEYQYYCFQRICERKGKGGVKSRVHGFKRTTKVGKRANGLRGVDMQSRWEYYSKLSSSNPLQNLLSELFYKLMFKTFTFQRTLYWPRTERLRLTENLSWKVGRRFSDYLNFFIYLDFPLQLARNKQTS